MTEFILKSLLPQVLNKQAIQAMAQQLDDYLKTIQLNEGEQKPGLTFFTLENNLYMSVFIMKKNEQNEFVFSRTFVSEQVTVESLKKFIEHVKK